MGTVGVVSPITSCEYVITLNDPTVRQSPAVVYDEGAVDLDMLAGEYFTVSVAAQDKADAKLRGDIPPLPEIPRYCIQYLYN